MKHIIEAAKAELVSNGSIQPKIIAKKGDEVFILLLEFPDSKGKEITRRIVKAQLEKMQPDEYFFISEAWVSIGREDRLYREPRRDVDKKEAILIMKYHKELKECKTSQVMFKKEEGKYIFEETPDLKYAGSAWDIWRKLDSNYSIKEHNEKVIKKWAKEIKDEFYPELVAAKTPEERMAVMKKTIQRCKEKYEEHMKTILEDTEKDSL